MRVSLRLVLAGACLALALGAAGPAFAHARLVRSVPADGAVLAEAPRQVRVFFDDAVVPTGGIRAIRNGGGSVLAGRVRTPAGSRRELAIPLRPHLPRGDYSVRWKVISDDGHVISGVLAFAVGTGRAPPASTLSAGGSGPTARDAVSRWLFFAGLLLAGGTAAFSLGIWRPALRAAGLGDPGRARISALLVAGCALAVLGGLLLLERASTSTRFGLLVAVGVLGAAGVATLSTLGYAERRLRPAGEATALSLLLVPTLAGHALDPGRTWIEPVADLLHLASAAIWFGGLAALFAVVPCAGRAGPELATIVVRRFSAVALGAVAILSATGVVRALAELTSFDQLWTTGYGRTILVKSGLLLGLASLAWVNRYRLVPRLPEPPAIRRLRGLIGVETLLLLGLVAAVAVLTELRPGRDLVATPAREVGHPSPVARGSLVVAKEAGSLAVALEVPPASQPRLRVSVLAPTGDPLSGLPVSFRIGAGRLASDPCGPGCYEARAPTSRRPREVELALGRNLTVAFRLPARWPPADAIVRRAARVFRRLRSVVFVETLRSGPVGGIVTTWRLAAPDRVEYRIRGGASAVVIGRRRWDRLRPGGPWKRSTQIPPLRVPQPSWGDVAVDAHVLGTARIDGRPVWIVSFADPTVPAWFTASIDRRTYRPLRLRMTAAAHFMFHRYLEFDRPLEIRPPR